MRLAPCLILAGCAHAWLPPDGATVSDRGTFHSASNADEAFAVADRADGGHVIHADVTVSRFGRKYTSAGTLVVDAAWKPLEGTFQDRGIALKLVREHGALVVKNPEGTTVSNDTTPSDIFYTGYTGSVFLEPLCAIRGRKQLSMFPDRAITVDGEQQSDEETAAAANAYHFHPRDHVILVSVTGAFAAELVCDGRALVAVKEGGDVAVRPGYEGLGQVMP